ncbi:MAG: hypothetical protein D6695_11365, partial [Planctomycetota bacterium]
MSFKPGQTLKCTISQTPRAKGPRSTIARLMRRDPDINRSLKRAQRMRRQRMHAYIRGGRMWYNREKRAKIARVEVGNSWTMPYTPDLEADLASVSPYL